jgi:predicted MFS family arabinose efflux permease
VSDIGTVSPAKGLYWKLCLLGSGLFLAGTNAVVIAGLLPNISESLGTSRTEVSYSITMYAFVVAVGAPTVAILIPRLNRTALMSTGLALISVGTFLAASSHDLPWFMVGRVLAGLGGAALVPAATVAAAAIAPPEKRGRAIAIVAAGFTVATAAGSPLGTALGSVAGWRAPLYVVATLAVLVATAMIIFVRRVPIGETVSLAARFAPLGRRLMLAPLITTFFMVAAFNTVYVFSSAVTEPETGGDGRLLALLLLIFGISGIVGNLLGGVLTDRLGNRVTASGALVLHAAALLAVGLFAGNYLATAVVFAIWGLGQSAAVPAVQHRLVSIDPATSAIALSWYTTALYLGIGVAPIVGGVAISLSGPLLIPTFGAIVALLALVAFQLGFPRTRRP